MSRLSTFVSALALCAPLTAQLDASLTTKGEYAVVANAVKDSVPDKTVIQNRIYLTAMDGISLEARKAYATTLAAQWENTLIGARMASVTDSAWARGGNKAGATSPHELIWKITTGKDTTGTLKLTYMGRVSGTGAKAEARIDFGSTSYTAPADGQARIKDFPGVKVGSAGLEVRIRTTATADSSSSDSINEAFGNLALTFVPDQPVTTCSIKTDKTSCKEGGTLGGTSKLEGQLHMLDFGLAGAPAKAFAISLISAKADTGSFGSGCVLFTQPLWVAVSLTDDQGATSLRLGIPAMTPLTGWIQMATARFDKSGLSLATSNTLVVDCR